MRNKNTANIYGQIDLLNPYSKTVLPEGLTVVSEQVSNSPYFALGFCIKSGSSSDVSGLEGTAHFVEHIAFRRTLHYTGKRLVTEFESIGAYVNAYTTKEMICFYVLALNSKFQKCFNLLSEVVLYPNIKASDVQKERNIILEEISSYEDDPEELIFDYGEQILFRNSSFEHPIVGYSESVKKIEESDLMDFHSVNFVADNIILAYSGPAYHQEILDMVSKFSFPINENAQRKKIELPRSRKIQTRIIEKKFQQDHILFITKTKGLSFKHRYIYAIINNIIGEGLSSRLNQSIREKFGYVYSVYSTLALMRDFGTIGIYAAADFSNTQRVEDLIINELRKIVNEGFTDKEIKSAKEQIKSSTIIGLDGVSSKMQSLARIEAVDGEYETINDTIRMIDEIQTEDIDTIIEKHLAPNKWSEVFFKSKG